MGKFERGEAEVLEKSLVNLLTGKSHTDAHHKCAEGLAKTVVQTNGNISIKSAVFIGRTYSEPGNIKIITADGKVLYIELKLLKGGKGTRANISQDALTELQLVYDPNGPTISWSKFRKINNFDKHVLSELNRFQKYPSYVKTKEEKAKYLIDRFIRPSPGESVEKRASEIKKSSRNPDELLAADIIMNIARLARMDKLNYIQYLRSLKQDSKRIQRFAILLLLGFHRVDALRKGLNMFDQIVKSLQSGGYNIKTYYVIKESCKVYVEDLSCLIPMLLGTQFKIDFPQNETNVIISYYDNQRGAYMPLLRIVFHWKNILQGIKTPCLNVFDEGILKGYLKCS